MTAATETHYDLIVAAIKEYTGLGWHILLTHGIRDGKCTCGSDGACKKGKHPLLSNGVFSATDETDWLLALFESQPWSNIAVRTGSQSGIIAVDGDSPKAVEFLKAQPGSRTWTSVTGRPEGGMHFIFRHPEIRAGYHVANGVSIGEKIDIRAENGYIMLPPSMHESGRRYTWSISPGDNPGSLLEMMPWVHDRIVIRPDVGLFEEDSAEEEILHEGGRNDYLFRFGCSLWTKKITHEELKSLLKSRNERLCDPPLDDDEVDLIATSIAERYQRGDTGVRGQLVRQVEDVVGPLNELPDILITAPMTDSGNAECLVELFGKDFRWCRAVVEDIKTSRGMLYWNGHVWREDAGRSFRDKAKWTARARARISDQAATKEARAKLYQHAINSENIARLEAMCELASTNERLLVTADQWDAAPMKLAVLNGVIDLNTGQFTDPDPNEYMTKFAPVKYDPTAECPTWIKALTDIFEDQPEVIPYLKRCVGYWLTGLTSEHTMWFFYGDGSNGKNTVIDTIIALLGDDLAGPTSFATFDDKMQNEKNDDLAGLRGKRFVAASESDRGRVIAEAKIKTVVSGDHIRVRFLHGNFFDMQPTFKVVAATNNLPEVKGTDFGIWRRIRLIAFNQKFEGDRKVLGMSGLIIRELPGVLNWALEGLQDWRVNGMQEPQSVIRSTEDMRFENDSFTRWFDEKMHQDDAEKVELNAVYTDYRRSLKDGGEQPLPKASWQRKMKERGLNFEASGKSNRRLLNGWTLVTDSGL